MDWMESIMTESSPALKRLHNFSLPSDLKWGNQKQLRCKKFRLDEEISAEAVDDRRFFSSKEDSDSLHKRKKKEKFIYDPSLVSSDFRRQSGLKKVDFDVKAVTFTPPPARKFKSSGNGGGDAGDNDDEGSGIAAVREKLISDIRIAADKLIWKEDMETPVEEQYCNNSSSPEKLDAPACVDGEAKRASLRTVKGSEFDAMKYTNNKTKNHPIRLRNGGGGATRDKEEMVKFTATISKSEIEDDFMALTGRRPPRKPKKRPRSVQKDIDSIYPGFWLTEVKSGSRYKVSENHYRVGR